MVNGNTFDLLTVSVYSFASGVNRLQTFGCLKVLPTLTTIVHATIRKRLSPEVELQIQTATVNNETSDR